MLLVTLLLAGQTLNLGADAMRTGQDRYLGAELGVESGSPVTVPAATRTHGIVRLRYIERALIPGPGGIDLDLNTDTATLSYFHPGLFGERSWSQTYLRAQGFAANLLTDHARAGVQVPGRGFGAGYLLGGTHLGATLVRTDLARVYVAGQLEARQWFHFAMPTTSPGLVLPPANQALEPTLFATVDGVDWQTPLRRPHGVRTWAQVGGIARLGARNWGQLNGNDDKRNHIGPWGARAEAGIQGGAVAPQFVFVRPVVEVGLRGGLSQGLDDRDRFRVGGDNPWVIPLAGAGWAEFLVDDYAWGQACAGLLVFDRVGLDLGGEVAMINDPYRRGDLTDVRTFSGAFFRVVARPIDAVVVTLRVAQSLSLPRTGVDPYGLAGTKGYLNLEWRALPWPWW